MNESTFSWSLRGIATVMCLLAVLAGVAMGVEVFALHRQVVVAKERAIEMMNDATLVLYWANTRKVARTDSGDTFQWMTPTMTWDDPDCCRCCCSSRGRR